MHPVIYMVPTLTATRILMGIIRSEACFSWVLSGNPSSALMDAASFILPRLMFHMALRNTRAREKIA